MNILLVLPPSFPAIICSTVLIRCLKKAQPNAFLNVLIPAQFGHWLAANGHIDQLLPAQGLHTGIAPGKYKVLIDCAALEENRQWAKSTGVTYCSISSRSFRSFLSGWFHAAQKEHLVLQMVSAARSLGVQNDGLGMEVHLSEGDKVTQHDIPTSHSAGYVALVLGAAMTLRLALLELFCAKLPFPVMLIGHSSLFAAAQSLAQLDSVKIYNACGKFSEGETADLMRRSRLVVSADAGWLQVAAAFGKPAIILHTGEQSPSLLPPLYAGHLQQGAEPPFWVLPVPAKALYRKTTKNEKMPAEVEPFAEKLVNMVLRRL